MFKERVKQYHYNRNTIVVLQLANREIESSLREDIIKEGHLELLKLDWAQLNRNTYGPRR